MITIAKVGRWGLWHRATPLQSLERNPFLYEARRTASTLPKLPIFKAIAQHNPHKVAIIHSDSNRRFSYGQLLKDVATANEEIYHHMPSGQPLKGQPVAFLVESSYDYVVTILSILGNHAIAIPLSPGFPANELRYILNNSAASILVSSAKLLSKAEEVVEKGVSPKPAIKVVVVAEKHHESQLNQYEKIQLLDSHEETNMGGLMLYTSGTTSRPKGVLLPDAAITAQCRSLIEAWRYSPQDHLLHVLPLHHIHGIVNGLLAPLFAGSSIEFMSPSNPSAVWGRLAAPFLPCSNPQKKAKEKITLFTAVPTIYNRLLSDHAKLPPYLQDPAREAVAPYNLRLNLSGSAALPAPTRAAWTELSHGNVLLERYGMTEVGMALSCGLDFDSRVAESVGWPLPSVEARLVDIETDKVISPDEYTDQSGKERFGEIQLRGPTVFKEYWKDPKATEEAFVGCEAGGEKWFKTGDVAVCKPSASGITARETWMKGPMYFIKGRRNEDIIKTGGEKVSALEVERELLSLPQVAEAAVLGLPSEVWGQKIVALIVLKSNQGSSHYPAKKWRVLDIRRALAEKLAKYKLPQGIKVIRNELPRNAMGKVNKKILIKKYFSSEGE